MEDFVVTSGDADFSKYVALEAHLHRFTDNALQECTGKFVSNILLQFYVAGGGSFTQY